MPKIFDNKGNEIGREYFQMVNSRDDGHFYEFDLPDGKKAIVAWQYRSGFHGPVIRNENDGLAAYEKWLHTGSIERLA